MTEILSWRIPDALKISLLELTSKEISIYGKNYSTEVCLHVLNHNFKKSDQSCLFSAYENYEEAVRDTIFGLALTEIREIIKKPKAVSGHLKRRLLRSRELSRESKIELFAAMLPDLTEKEVKYFLKVLKLTEYLKIFEPKSRPKFTVDSANERLLLLFQEREWIENYLRDQDRDGYYKIFRKKRKVQ